MTMIDGNGDYHGVDGRYQERNRRDAAGFQLNPHASLADENAAWLAENGLHLNAEGIQLMTDALDGWPINAIVRVEAFKNAFEVTNGYTYEQAETAKAAAVYLDLQGRADMAAAIRAVMGDPITGEKDTAPARHAAPTYGGWENSNGDGSLENPAPFNDPRVQGGQVLDTIRDEDGVTTWHRRRELIKPSAPTGIRLQANEPLSEDDIEHLRSLIAYQYAATAHRDEIGMDVRQDSPYSFIVDVNYEGSVRPNWGPFEKHLPAIIQEGSLLRSTNRSGPGTAVTRAVEPFPRKLSFQLYYDDVQAGVNLADPEGLFDEGKVNAMHGRLVDLGYARPTIQDLNGMMSGSR